MNLNATSKGARRDQSPAATRNAAIETHFTALICDAFLLRSCAGPFATQARHTSSSSGSAAGTTHTLVDSSDLPLIGMPGPRLSSRELSEFSARSTKGRGIRSPDLAQMICEWAKALSH